MVQQRQGRRSSKLLRAVPVELERHGVVGATSVPALASFLVVAGTEGGQSRVVACGEWDLAGRARLPDRGMLGGLRAELTLTHATTVRLRFTGQFQVPTSGSSPRAWSVVRQSAKVATE